LFFLLFPFFEKKQAVDRKGRFHGNVLALFDVAKGEIDPMNLVRVKQNLEKTSGGTIKKN